MHPALVKALETGRNYDEAIEEAAAPMRQAISSLLQQRPFVPFRIHMTGGNVREIRQPERVALHPATVCIGDPAPNGELHNRHILALIHVVSLETLTVDEPTVVVETPRISPMPPQR